MHNQTANYKRGGYDKVISDLRLLLFAAKKAENALLYSSHFEVRTELQKAIKQAQTIGRPTSDIPNSTTRHAPTNGDPLNPRPNPILVGTGNPLPVGWTVTEYPSTIDLHDHTGRFMACVPKPYERGHTLGELIEIGVKQSGATIYRAASHLNK